MIKKICTNKPFKAPDCIFWLIANLYNGILENYEDLEDLTEADIAFDSDIFSYDYDCVKVAMRAVKELGYQTELPAYCKKTKDGKDVYTYEFILIKTLTREDIAKLVL